MTNLWLWNCDETGFGDKPKSKVICQKGKRHIYRQQTTSREHITVHVAVSAAGESVPPFIIYPRCLPSVAYALGGPENSLYGYADKGYMMAELFLKWLDHFIKYAPPARPLVLIMDQHETHCGRQIIDVCRENQIEILLLPPHTTHMLQPLDISVFNPLKGMFSTVASRMGLVRGDMVIGKKHFSSVLKHAYEKAVTPANIKAGFRKAGIYPLSREAVDMTQCSFCADLLHCSRCALLLHGSRCTLLLHGSSCSLICCAQLYHSSSFFLLCCAHLFHFRLTCLSYLQQEHENHLVETGLIPQYLADMLVTPTLGQRAEGIRRRVPLQARVITSDDYVAHLDNLEAKEKEKEEQKKKRKEEQEKNREAKRARQAKAARRGAPAMDDGSYCSVCKSTLPPAPVLLFFFTGICQLQ
ncbi:unnamed protein product [Leuciscus chuanchicus]